MILSDDEIVTLLSRNEYLDDDDVQLELEQIKAWQSSRELSILRMKFRKARRITILGKTRSGKSYFAYHYLAKNYGEKMLTLIVDIVNEFNEVPLLGEQIPDRGLYRVTLESLGTDDPLFLMEFGAFLISRQEDAMLYVEETGQMASKHSTKMFPALRHLVQVAARRNVGLITVFQRTQDLNALFVDQADYVFVFNLTRKGHQIVQGFLEMDFDNPPILCYFAGNAQDPTANTPCPGFGE